MGGQEFKPGWYPVEGNTSQERYWDGNQWVGPTRPKAQLAANPIGLGMALVGAAAMIVAVFLPWLEDTGSHSPEFKRTRSFSKARAGYS